MNNFTIDKTIYLNNTYLREQARKLLSIKPEERKKKDIQDFWYVFHKLVPGYMGLELNLGCNAENYVFFVHLTNFRVIVVE